MKRIFFFVVLIWSVADTGFAQETKPALLKQPVNWEFERFSLPPAFDPGFNYKGFEELRFAPGMFKKDSADYFSYAFIASLDGNIKFSAEDIRLYLLRYYRGLCGSVAREKKLIIDSAAIRVIKGGYTKSKGRFGYNYSLNIFGVFADGSPVKLNMEAEVIPGSAYKKTYLLFITSPQPKTAAIWKKLYELRQGIRIPRE
ncbi:MAG: hypothetical protein ABI688_02985 [Bacteroidota bacterium]